MKLLNIFSLLIAIVTSNKVHEIFSRYHFHDLLQDVPMGYRYASVIAFYNKTNECEQEFKRLNFEHKDLPSSEFLMLGRYEMSNAQERFWYNWEEEMDLVKYLKINEYITKNSICECPILVYVPPEYGEMIGDDYLNSPNITNIEIWDSIKEPNWKTWIWGQYKKKIIIESEPNFDFQITIVPNEHNPLYNTDESKQLKHYLIKSGELNQYIECYVHDQIFISYPNSNRNNPVETVTLDMKKLHITKLNDNDYGIIITRRDDINAHLTEARHSTTTVTHTHNAIIPLVLPKYDKLGFVKLKMPLGLHERLLNYYHNYYEYRKEEPWDKSATQLNSGFDIKSYLVSLDHGWEERDTIANDVIKPILEKWSNQSLEFTSFYGIRDYTRGASLRNHVDRSETHIFSAILQVMQVDMDEDWPLEVIGFDGNRYQINMQPGEMVLYEGSTLIHGRPKPLKGEMYSNAFCHFKPKSGWNWNMHNIFHNKDAANVLDKLHVAGSRGIF